MPKPLARGHDVHSGGGLRVQNASGCATHAHCPAVYVHRQQSTNMTEKVPPPSTKVIGDEVNHIRASFFFPRMKHTPVLPDIHQTQPACKLV